MENLDLEFKSDEELKKIALDLFNGDIFSDRQCQTPEDVKSSFMVLMFMDEENQRLWEEMEVDFIYEYMKEASPMGVNGRPMFMSCRALRKPETKKMFEFYNKIKETIDSI
jgi:hypothetical protein